MIGSLIWGIGGIIILMVGWMLIQQSWGKMFSEQLTDEDVLAGRSSCGNCGCTAICKEKK